MIAYIIYGHEHSINIMMKRIYRIITYMNTYIYQSESQKKRETSSKTKSETILF